jgi:competence ComEA-like helix-hairpin-helix protein
MIRGKPLWICIAAFGGGLWYIFFTSTAAPLPDTAIIRAEQNSMRRADTAQPPEDSIAATPPTDSVSKSDSAKPAINCIDPNTATVTQLTSLYGIGPTIARRIVAYREQHGAFTDIEQLKEVKGIGPKRLSRIQNDICLQSVK